MTIFALARAAFATLLTAVLTNPVAAQQWPARSVKLIVPYPAGGNVDGAARIVADRLQTMLGQPFIVENKAGAGGLIAGEAFAKSVPDGYTLFVGANGPVLFAPEIAKRATPTTGSGISSPLPRSRSRRWCSKYIRRCRQRP